jgi:uncharacterized protein YecE (DUF72 family)
MSVKASRGLTHAKNLYVPGEVSIDRIAACWHELGSRRGVVLVQLAPTHVRDDARLGASCPGCRGGCASRWRSGSTAGTTRRCFASSNATYASYCVMSGARLPCPLVATAPCVYLRLHGPDEQHLYTGSYSETDLRWWAPDPEWDAQGRDVYA